MTNEQIILLIESTDLQQVKLGLTSLFDSILNNGNITNSEEIGKLVRLRSRIEIDL